MIQPLFSKEKIHFPSITRLFQWKAECRREAKQLVREAKAEGSLQVRLCMRFKKQRKVPRANQM